MGMSMDKNSGVMVFVAPADLSEEILRRFLDRMRDDEFKKKLQKLADALNDLNLSLGEAYTLVLGLVGLVLRDYYTTCLNTQDEETCKMMLNCTIGATLLHIDSFIRFSMEYEKKKDGDNAPNPYI